MTHFAFAVPRSDTIAAVATAVAPGQGGIAVIRLSGPVAQQVGQAVVRCPAIRSGSAIEFFTAM